MLLPSSGLEEMTVDWGRVGGWEVRLGPAGVASSLPGWVGLHIWLNQLCNLKPPSSCHLFLPAQL